MVEKIIKYILAFIGLCIGVAFGIYLAELIFHGDIFSLDGTFYVLLIPLSTGLIFAFLTYLMSKLIISGGKKLALYAQNEVEKIPPHELVFGMVGLVSGLILALLISSLYEIIPIPMVANALKILTFIFFGYLGINLAQKNVKDVSRLQDWARKFSLGKPSSKPVAAASGAIPKVLDTSVIIDGRISDICKTGFVEGPIIIPEFVLKELRHIADSSDGLKRNRGRRGLDILKIIQKDLPIEVQIVDTDFDDVDEVDLKLIKLAQKIGGAIVTNDYNLNKVATLQDILILNINELANAVKPIVLPGEEMVVQILKEGKESNQGIAYLDDGTMIVVEEGKRYMNVTIHVVVTSVLQTAAGRMIFAKHK